MGLFEMFRKKEVDMLAEYNRNRKIKDISTEHNRNMGEFRMEVADVFGIIGKGVLVVGGVSSGFIEMNELLEVKKQNGKTIIVKVSGIERFRKKVKHAKKGDNIGILFKGVSKEDITQKDILVKKK